MPYQPGNYPDTANCVARQAGVGGLFFCLAEHRTHCSHALSYGEAYFCRHPQAREIAARAPASGDQPNRGD